jgi:hypothetical protein
LTTKAAINAALEANVVAQNKLQNQQPAFPPFEYRQPSNGSPATAHSPANSVEGTDWSSPTLNDFTTERYVTDAFVSVLESNGAETGAVWQVNCKATATCG